MLLCCLSSFLGLPARPCFYNYLLAYSIDTDFDADAIYSPESYHFLVFLSFFSPPLPFFFFFVALRSIIPFLSPTNGKAIHCS